MAMRLISGKARTDTQVGFTQRVRSKPPPGFISSLRSWGTSHWPTCVPPVGSDWSLLPRPWAPRGWDEEERCRGQWCCGPEGPFCLGTIAGLLWGCICFLVSAQHSSQAPLSSPSSVPAMHPTPRTPAPHGRCLPSGWVCPSASSAQLLGNLGPPSQATMQKYHPNVLAGFWSCGEAPPGRR